MTMNVISWGGKQKIKWNNITASAVALFKGKVKFTARVGRVKIYCPQPKTHTAAQRYKIFAEIRRWTVLRESEDVRFK